MGGSFTPAPSLWPPKWQSALDRRAPLGPAEAAACEPPLEAAAPQQEEPLEGSPWQPQSPAGLWGEEHTRPALFSLALGSVPLDP